MQRVTAHSGPRGIGDTVRVKDRDANGAELSTTVNLGTIRTEATVADFLAAHPKYVGVSPLPFTHFYFYDVDETDPNVARLLAWFDAQPART
jgi:hypothetical protein